MATIFPTSPAPQVNDEFQGYRYNGTSWEIIGIDLTADYQPRVTNVSDTEIGYLDGVTSAIQTQLTDKSTASKTETLTNKTLTTPKINEDVALTATSTELNVLDGATLTTTELNYVDGVTSSIQTQLGTKAPLDSPTFTGTVAGITKSMVGLSNVDNTTDAGKPISTATQTALDGKSGTAHSHAYLSTSGGAVGSITVTGTILAYSNISTNGGFDADTTIHADGIIDSFTHIRNQWVEMFDTGGVGYSRPMADNDTQSGSSSRRWTRVFAVNTTISSSDERDKLDINDSPLGLDFINDLRPVAYRWKVGEKKAIIDQEGKPILDADGNKTYEIREGVRKHYGLISQEVKQALDNSGVDDFAGWVQDDLSDPDSHQSISYEQFIAPLIKSVQELSAEVQTLKAKVAELEAEGALNNG
jgi:hypothetical protein